MKITFVGNKKVNVEVKGFNILTDQKKENGGDASAPTPIDLFLASLGSCSGVFVLNFLKMHLLPETVYLTLNPVWNINEYVIERIELVIHLPHDFPAGFDHALVEVAKRCLVARHVKIAHDIRIERDPAPSA
ncbi:OsmC family protein [Candidatus Avelusimicrobium aviculae]|uniref:OsmC family protein n=1 Tax=Candidatus Avelusimicrobium aviculae TaxID=3416206 RepID=UPI003D0EC4E1